MLIYAKPYLLNQSNVVLNAGDSPLSNYYDKLVDLINSCLNAYIELISSVYKLCDFVPLNILN